MALKNTKIKYKVIVEGVTSYVRIFFADLLVTLSVGDIITGDSSGATAYVLKESIPSGGNEPVRVSLRTGSFLTRETFSVGAVPAGAKLLGFTTLQLNYTNAEYGIDNGTWTFDTDGGLVNQIKPAKQKINVSKGGNLASGYSFGFKIKNDEFIKTVKIDGVFFNNLKCQLLIEVNGVYEPEWTGIIETFKFSDESTVDVQCTDLTKNLTEKIGSTLVPIALNRNWDCKLVYDETLTEKYTMIRKDGLDYDMFVGIRKISGFPYKFVMQTNVERLTSPTNQDLADSNFENGLIEVLVGPDAGNIFKILGVDYNLLFDDGFGDILAEYTFSLDQKVDNIVVTNNDVRSHDVSIFRVFSNRNTYALSQNEPKQIDTNINSLRENPPRIISDEFEFPLSESSTWNIYNKTSIVSSATSYHGISIDGIDDSDNILIFSEFDTPIDDNNIKLDPPPYIEGRQGASYGLYVNIKQDMDSSSKEKLDIIAEKDVPTYISTDIITLFDVINVIRAPLDLIITYEVKSTYRKAIWEFGETSLIKKFTIPLNLDDNNVPDALTILNGTDIQIDLKQAFRENSELFQITNYYKSDAVNEINIVTDIVVLGAFDSFKVPSSVTVDNVKITYGGDKSVKSIGTGCIGENVINGSFESASNTIKYLLEQYMGIPITDINTPSFQQADIDTDLFPSYSKQNLAHQIVEVNDSNTILKDLCYSSHMGLFIDRSGKYRLDTWLPLSTVFTDSTSSYIFTEAEFESISKITRDNLNNIITDIKMETHFREYDSVYEKTIRIKNTNFDPISLGFDPVTDQEGLDSTDMGTAAVAYDLLSLGWKRARKTNQLQVQNKWFKSKKSDGTGNSDSINWVRNISAHLNREHEYLTLNIPMTRSNLDLELLTFVIVKDQFVTDNDFRKGWIVERTIDTRNHVVVWKILLDINPKDPFFYQIGVLQDVYFPDDGIIIDDQSSTDILDDGAGK
jgi:hypothetical protein